MSEHYYIIIIALVLAISCLLLVLVRRERARMRKFEQEMMNLNKVPFEKIEEPTPEDEEAYRIIEEERKRIWKNFSSDTELTVEYVLSLSRELVRKIAAVYYPEKEEPLYQASVAGLLHLVRRVTERMEGYLNTFPLTFLRDRTIADMLVLHRGYKKVKESPLVKILGNKFVDMGRKIAWGAYNVSNPWYYGRHIVWAVGKEVGMRYLLTLIVTIAGEEAVLLYRKKNG